MQDSAVVKYTIHNVVWFTIPFHVHQMDQTCRTVLGTGTMSAELWLDQMKCMPTTAMHTYTVVLSKATCTL